MVKKFIKRYPGLALAVMFGQLLLIGGLLIVVCLNARTVASLRRADETRAAAVLASNFRRMEQIAEDNTLSDDRKRLILYQMTQSAVEALAETGYDSEIKRELTAALNGISRHMLESKHGDEASGLLSAEERAFLRQMGHTVVRAWDATENEAYGMLPAPSSADSSTAEKMVRENAVSSANRKAAGEEANRIFGVEGVLCEMWADHMGGRITYACKNAYAVMDGKAHYPIEAAMACSITEERFTAEECYTAAGVFVEEIYPKHLSRRLSVVSERDCGGWTEVVFGGDVGTVWVKVSKGNGRMTEVRSFINEGVELPYEMW